MHVNVFTTLRLIFNDNSTPHHRHVLSPVMRKHILPTLGRLMGVDKEPADV